MKCVYWLGSLDKLLFRTKEPLSESDKLNLVKGIARGMFHLHSYNIIHRDLAARNILLSATREPKISVYLSLFFIFSVLSFPFLFVFVDLLWVWVAWVRVRVWVRVCWMLFDSLSLWMSLCLLFMINDWCDDCIYIYMLMIIYVEIGLWHVTSVAERRWRRTSNKS
jgi:hypothetical protein